MAEIEILSMIEEALIRRKEDVVFFYGKAYSSATIVERYRSVARFLADNGIEEGDVVAVDLLNRPELLFIILGSWLVGASVTPINVQLKAEEIAYQLRSSGSRIVFAETGFREKINAAIDSSGTGTSAAILDFDAADNGGAEYSRVFLEGADYQPDPKNPQVLFIIYTSGTTGKPKGAMLTSGNVFNEIIQLQNVVNIREKDRMIIVLPLFHVNNLMFSLSFLMKGASMAILRKFQSDEFFEYCEKYSPTMFSGVPTIYKMLVDAWTPERKEALRSIEVGICGAAPMPIQWFEEFERLYGIKIMEGYGMTEGTVASTINPRYGVRKIGSIGIPFPGQDVRVFSDADESLPPGEIGEIVIRGPNVMKEYFNMPEETASTLRNGWLHSGDIGYMDPDGYFYLVDRKKDMIIRGGENVYPKEVENQMIGIPGVSEVAVIGRPDDVYGEEVIAFIARKDDSLTAHDVLEYCRKNIAWYKSPKEVFFITEIPKNSVGKVSKPELRKMLKNRTLQGTGSE